MSENLQKSELSAKSIFKSFYHKASKHLGQNFLLNESVSRKIVAAAGDLSGKTVVEIGPGSGGLTLEILKQDVSCLYVVEYDRHWAEVWRKIQPAFGNRLVLVECDALRFNMLGVSPQIVISNLPYNISTQLLCSWLPEFDKYEALILMFQKEVADRICANPRTKAYGRLSVLSQWKAKVLKSFDLDAGCFTPRPKVSSCVVKFLPYQQSGVFESDNKIQHFRNFSLFLGNVFCHRRKALVKALSKYFSNPCYILQSLGYDSLSRPEDIRVDDFLRIFYQISEMDPVPT